MFTFSSLLWLLGHFQWYMWLRLYFYWTVLFRGNIDPSPPPSHWWYNPVLELWPTKWDSLMRQWSSRRHQGCLFSCYRGKWGSYSTPRHVRKHAEASGKEVCEWAHPQEDTSDSVRRRRGIPGHTPRGPLAPFRVTVITLWQVFTRQTGSCNVITQLAFFQSCHNWANILVNMKTIFSPPVNLEILSTRL